MAWVFVELINSPCTIRMKTPTNDMVLKPTVVIVCHIISSSSTNYIYSSMHLHTSVFENSSDHYSDVIMGAMASQISSISIVCSTVCSAVDQRTHKGSASLAFVRGIHRSPVDSPHKGLVTRKRFQFDDIVMMAIVLAWWLILKSIVNSYALPLTNQHDNSHLHGKA